MNRRRRVVLATAAAGLARAGSAWSQAPARLVRIGWISSNAWPSSQPSPQWLGIFTEGMRERGWVEGTNYVLDVLHYDGHAERIPALAAELVQRRPDVIVASGSTPVRPLMQATQTIPIVFLNAADPVGSGFVSNLARPGGNVTGLGGLASGQNARQLDLLKQAVPRARRIGLAHNPDLRLHAVLLPELQAAAQRLGVELRPVTLRSPDELGPAFAALARERVDVTCQAPCEVTWWADQDNAVPGAVQRVVSNTGALGWTLSNESAAMFQLHGSQQSVPTPVPITLALIGLVVLALHRQAMLPPSRLIG